MFRLPLGMAVPSLALLLYACGSSSPASPDGGSNVDGNVADASAPATARNIGGTISGLEGSGLTLKVNDGDSIAVSGSSFTLPTNLSEGDAYQVVVATHPSSPTQVCTVQNGSGTIGSADVTDIAVTCVDAFAVNVAVVGLVAGSTLVLQNNGGDDLSVTTPSTVTFPTPLRDGAAYAVTVKSQPGAPPQTCAVSSGSGTIASSPATIVVQCEKVWRHARTITLESDLAASAADHAILVVLRPSFSYAKTIASGADLRFSSTASFGDSLPYYIESWNPGGTSFVWVKVPTVPAGTSSIVMHYGAEGVSEASVSFATFFPTARITAGGGVGSFTADANIDVDWFELKTGDTLALGAGAPRVINAKRIILAGNVDGGGRGHASPAASSTGSGAGGGGTSSNTGAGGGGYGGAGGNGGIYAAQPPGAGGTANGTASGLDIDLGSSGGSTAGGVGGAGGGALTLRGTFVTVRGRISLDGAAGTSNSIASGGGGAGGGLLAFGTRLDFATAIVTARGGNGGAGPNSGSDSGGGGGGGRLKFFASSFFKPPTMAVSFGLGGGGQDGAVGTIYSTEAASSPVLPSVRATVGPEK